MIVEPKAEQLTQIAELMMTGKLRAHTAQTFSLQNAQKAHRLIETDHVREKIVLKVLGG